MAASLALPDISSGRDQILSASKKGKKKAKFDEDDGMSAADGASDYESDNS